MGIAAAEVSEGKNLADLETDFNKINEILSSLVHEVQGSLSLVWPALKYILKWSGKVDALRIIRITERGSVAAKIRKMQ